MAYLDLLEKEGIDSQYLCVLSPKRKITGFTLFSGSVYSASFTYGHVSSVTIDGVALTEGASVVLSAGEFFYADDVLYVRKSDSTSPASNFVVGTYELYFGTKDEHWFRDPLDDSTDDIYYEAKIEKSPELKSDITEALFGFQPIQRSALSLINADHELERHVYDSSFSKARIRLWHVLREKAGTDIDIDNIKLVYDGLLGNFSYEQSRVRIESTSAEDELNVDYRNDEESFYSLSLFPNLDPRASGYPIRYVYGVVDGFVPVNVDFVDSETATTSDNRNFAVIGEQANLNNVTATVGGGTHTTTRTYLAALLGLRVGDHVFMDRASGTDNYAIITAVGANYIEHDVLPDGAMTNGDTVKRSFVGSITIIQEGVVYRPLFNRDYTTNGAMAGGVSGFVFTDNFEANLSMPSTFTSNDQIFCRVYGRKNDLTLGGPSFGSNDTESGNITNPVMVALDLYKRTLGISESRLNAASFTAALALRTDALGFSIPESNSGRFPKVKDILTNIIESSFLSFYVDNDLLWTVKAVEPLGASTIEIDDTEILIDSISYDFSYRDLYSDFLVEYNYRELTESLVNSSDARSTVSSTSDVATNLHGISRQKTIGSLHFKTSDATECVNRYKFLFGDRFGQIEIKAKNRFFQTEVGDVLEISRTKLPGFAYDPDVDQTKKFSVSAVTKNRTTITISAFDQKGIEDNSGSW